MGFILLSLNGMFHVEHSIKLGLDVILNKKAGTESGFSD